jgi:hypothetical protein
LNPGPLSVKPPFTFKDTHTTLENMPHVVVCKGYVNTKFFSFSVSHEEGKDTKQLSSSYYISVKGCMNYTENFHIINFPYTFKLEKSLGRDISYRVFKEIFFKGLGM